MIGTGAYKPSDFLERHIFAAYVNIKSAPFVNGVAVDDDAIVHKVVRDALAIEGQYIYRAAYMKLTGKQAWPEVVSSESGNIANLRFESQPEGLGITKLMGAGGGLAPAPIAWKHELSGLYVASNELKTVTVKAGEWIGLVSSDDASLPIWGFSIDTVPATAGIASGGSSSPSHTAYRVDDAGTIYTDDLGGLTSIFLDKGIYLVQYTVSPAYKYLLLQAPAASDMVVITVNEVAQIVEVAS